MIDFCVSFTSIPSRIDNIEKTIDSINSQTLKANKIFLNLPYEFKRFPNNKFSENQILKLRKFNIELNIIFKLNVIIKYELFKTINQSNT